MSIILRTDVTSVKIYENWIVAGIGSSFNIFKKDSSKLLQRVLCLNGQKIYGFVPSKSRHKIFVFGGKQFTVLVSTGSAATDDEAGVFARLFDPVVSDDWIHSAVWMDEDNVALLTAHNVVQKWDTTIQTLTSQHCSKDNSILYSGLLLSLGEEVLIMAGTVFSEVIVNLSGDEEPLHRLAGHKGVIFSISCDLNKGIIVTTSDDRSMRIWGSNSTPDHPCNTVKYWKSVDIVCKHEVYGHTARVMRSCITIDKIISVGEDSAICFWNHDGSLAKKIISHQNGCVWAVDADEDILVTGGGDCGVILHPLSLATDYSENDTLDLDIEAPKKVVFTARRNIVVLNENNDLVFYNVEEKSKTVTKLSHDSTYKLVSISSCKQMVAVADMNGKLDVFAEICKEAAYLINIIDTKLPISKVLSMQWAGNRHLVICSENGVITILASKESSSETYTHFTLPPSKERWLTASAVDCTKTTFVLGDRCGNIHVYVKDQKNPIKSFSKVHGRYGPTSITIKNNEIITTGRDGTVKYFSINEDKVKLMSSKDLELKWVEKFLDRDENIVCGFQERVFAVCNIRTNSKLLDVPCGGGHRSWDAMRYFEKVNDEYEEFIKLVYLKNSDINIVKFQLSKIVSTNVVNGSHSKEINCLKTYQNEKNSETFYISGGEDTTLRISSVNTDLQFEDQVIFKQLSSIRTLKTCTLKDNKMLLISAGGRAQICIKIVSFHHTNNESRVKSQELVDYMIKGTDKMRKGNTNWRNCSIDFDPETRIMDVDYIEIGDGKFRIYAGCSDALLRVFTLDISTEEATFELTKELKYHRTCILKTSCINFMNKNILVTCTTRSEVAFWDSTDISKQDIKPFFVTRTNKSGINSFASKVIANDRLLIATAGDDNAMHIVLLEVSDRTNLSSMKELDSKTFDKHHSSEITGLCIVDNFMLSTAIDQRVTLFKWQVRSDGIECKFLSQTYSDVADIQGMDIISHSSSSITVCVFGKGMEAIDIPTQ